MSVRSKRQSRIRYAGDLQGELFMKDKEESEKRQTGKNLQMMSIGTPMKGRRSKGGFGRKILRPQLSSMKSQPG